MGLVGDGAARSMLMGRAAGVGGLGGEGVRPGRQVRGGDVMGAGCGGWRGKGMGQELAIAEGRGEVGNINTAAPSRWGCWEWGSAGDRTGGVGGLDW